ncbi:hypothetical protein [Vibrio gazogenes]|uniref:Uncharacterized protein n=1 Tax=Vibrio gazogenes DSM 21264 = NBRC 103151 TaxID=1123492 RepID=A0A1M5BR56_VIBGA|nr:hypothetical protein [Vibrio gazogenes]USP13690.1 hypothetical protein MKS89_15170 [Vibrio gazogenes]SHF44896.1 hypothetical protein SAMN02745781_02305 [Vibrio gazogenes DSM 21264] [Vibrio gazogenes DSM 21264 = NBRC 103151]SJN54420.1 hypothetical protein BQ6471_01003 [Vibrio gazogenes]
MKIDPDEFQVSDRAQLSHDHWQLEIASHTPVVFQLFSRRKLFFSGQLELINNDEVVSTEGFHWRFRIKNDRIEQWCNVQLGETLSLGITYSFQPDALVIEYMARNRVPTRLDIRHNIQAIQTEHGSEPRSVADMKGRVDQLQRQNNERPSDYLVESGNQHFREAFSATQWIFLS